MKLQWILLSICLSSSALALDGVYNLVVERDGVKHAQVAGNFWQGEYPGPVIDILSHQKGQTQIFGWASLRRLTERKACTVNNSLYHPWAEANQKPLLQKNSVINFYTIAPVVEYKVLQKPSADILNAFYFDEKTKGSLAPGDLIVNLFYLSEGVSTATVVRNGQRTRIELSWDVLETEPQYFQLVRQTQALKKVTYDDGEVSFRNEQWLHLNCAEGYTVFVEDEDLLSQKPVKEGSVVGYGQITGSK